jgi:hypothetical protein
LAKVAKWSELPDREPAYALVAGVDLVVVRYDDDVSAFYGHCLHRGAIMTRVVSRQISSASPVRCWPHHFDIATLITIVTNEPDPEKARSIGFGLAPGDQYYNAPYFCAVRWPIPKRIGFPPLEGNGQWHSTDWVGAVLPAFRIARGTAAEQGAQVAAFASSAVPAARSLLDAHQQ